MRQLGLRRIQKLEMVLVKKVKYKTYSKIFLIVFKYKTKSKVINECNLLLNVMDTILCLSIYYWVYCNLSINMYINCKENKVVKKLLIELTFID